MTALRKANGGVRGIVVGEVVRRLVARTMAQQLGPQVEAATASFQYAFSTRAGSECVAHVIQGLCEVNPEATVMLIDGISAFDQISRAAMLDGLFSRKGHPFVRMFCSSPSVYIWEDAEGVEHSILQGEGNTVRWRSPRRNLLRRNVFSLTMMTSMLCPLSQIV